ncbi:PAK-box/P21-Rho-binding [Penicillium concentricum]|uniref:PAK-box/P21-Rho-binding n=1 Tax=Penicillium concentricum TaxID=293559 RepID=A0A9W9SCI7_9EURO|nr:PAK-box/P21-Rho-binding [Penicillium concentricum]KAJ5373633.1 PAK-box/P21-Rho-binding [Penicillium concentricum]
MSTSTMAKTWDDDDRPSTNSSNEYPEHAAHIRSRSIALANSPKRISVFRGRSRSNTTTSTSSRRSPGSSMTSTDSSIASDERAVSSLGLRSDKQDKSSRSFLARGSRILRRQGSKINIVATLDEEDEVDREKARPEREIFGRRARQTDHSERLKSIISDPFDFHHLTHTNPSQFQSLDQTRENDLVTEFSAIRASQRPQTGLKGIRAEDIHFRNFSSDDLRALGTATTVDVPSVSPPASPKAHRHHTRRESRINENFSRPVSRYPRSCPTTPPPPLVPENPPPETDEPAPRAIDEILGLSTAMTYPDLQSVQPTRFFSPEPTEDGARTSSMSSHYDLEDVPEEEEGTRYWDSSESSVGCPHSRSTSQTSPPRTDAQSPSTSERKAPLSIYVAEELSRKFSEALGSPTLPQYLQDTPRAQVEPIASLHFSYEDELYDSWDADIDYCYEHAAESTSNFDWSRTSLDEARPQVGVACSEGPWLAPRTRQLQPSPLSTSALPTPDLTPSPAQSMPSHSAATPSTTDFEQEFIARGADYFHPVSSSILPSMGKHLSQEPLYEEYMTTDGESDRHFPFSQGMMGPISPRNSFSPISKCNSQESLMLSRAASIVRKHRSSVSTTTSVPELIYSLSSSRELMPTDRMTAGEALTRPASSSHHRQTKSLAEAHLRQNGSSTSLEGADLPVSLHDRAKSTSEVESQPMKFEVPMPPVPARNPNRRKARSPSYSLFPTTAH